jgi:REP element-mobilizing transposase RayT
VHMLISIPPKYAVSQVIGFIKGKSAIHLARVYGEGKRNFVGQGASLRAQRLWFLPYIVEDLPNMRMHCFKCFGQGPPAITT